MKDTASRTTRIMLDVLQRHDIDTIVLSPGSRNAPVLISCALRRNLRKYIIPDERTAAFVALGIAMASGRPVALACTSGTALYNYAPAVAEAFHQKIPLVVITADRPSQWIDQDDSQTLRQYGSLDNIVKGSYNLPVDSCRDGCANNDYGSEGDWFANRSVNEAILTATTGIPGPVHINIQLDTPLGEIKELSRRPIHKEERTIRQIDNPSGLPPHVMEQLAEELAGRRIMLTAGFMSPSDSMNRAVMAFAALPNVTVFAETLSNLHIPGHPFMVDTILTRLSQEELERLRPDVVISIGGALVSRMLKEYLRKSEVTEHWTLGDTGPATDCFQRLTTHIAVLPDRFLKGMAGMLHRITYRKGIMPPEYGREWHELRHLHHTQIKKEIHDAGWSELKAIHQICESLPPACNVFLSNGTAVRYAQLCMDRIPHACFGNRGVSGIDGTNATAYGTAAEYPGMTLLITGDMSFSYCPQIMQLPTENADLRIIVMNNDGGGIFRFIPTTRKLEMREEYFCVPADIPFRKLAEAYGWHHIEAGNEEELTAAIAELIATPRSMLEIKVDAQKSADILTKFLRTQ